MKFKTYHYEIKDVLTQFSAALDDIIIDRTTKDRVVEDQIQVNHLYAPKQKVLHDIQNKAKAVNIPVLCYSLQNVQRVNDRQFNKHDGSWYTTTSPLLSGVDQR